MSIKQNIPEHIQKVVSQIDEQIEYHQQIIRDLELGKQMWLTYKPYVVQTMPENSPLTRDLIRNFLKGYEASVQTVQVINLLYPDKTEEEKDKLVKTLSVIFNQMEKEGEITIKKKPGVKGNFYRWIKK